jgi:hypoxanthine phosphoribosyltransferase
MNQQEIVGRVFTAIVKGKKQSKKVTKILWNERAIKKSISVSAAKIGEYYRPILERDKKHDLLLVGVLNGALPILAGLLCELPKFLPSHRFRYDLIGISSYNQEMTGGELKVLKDLKDPVNGSYVLIVEDIVDKGHTFGCLKAIMNSKYPSAVNIFTLIDKTARRESDSVAIDFSGFILKEDLFVAGFGLDWAGYGRTLPYIVCLEDT